MYKGDVYLGERIKQGENRYSCDPANSFLQSQLPLLLSTLPTEHKSY